jgi:CspA family cold shock protein
LRPPVPPTEERLSMERGTVKFFNSTKGFGFITMDNNEEVFFHESNVKNTGFRSTLGQGDLVEFEIKNEQKGKRAYNISRV